MEYRGGLEEDYRVRSTDYGKAYRGDWLARVWLARGKVGTWQDRLQSAEYGVQSASRARERQLGWHAVPTLPYAGIGDSYVDWRTDATQVRAVTSPAIFCGARRRRLQGVSRLAPESHPGMQSGAVLKEVAGCEGHP
jgi:hypothetical protein